MPYFSFNIPIKKTKNKAATKLKSEWITKETNVKAYVDITEDLDYIAIIDNDNQIEIYPACYNSKGHKVIYSRLLHGQHKQRLIIHRIKDDCENHYPYLPFCVGAIIIGSIIIHSISLKSYFKIKKCYIDDDDPIAYHITKGFKEIYNTELEQRIINNYAGISHE